MEPGLNEVVNTEFASKINSALEDAQKGNFTSVPRAKTPPTDEKNTSQTPGSNLDGVISETSSSLSPDLKSFLNTVNKLANPQLVKNVIQQGGQSKLSV